MSEHDDLRFDDDDLDAGERVLVARLTSAMAVEARTIVLADEAFDPTRSAALDLAGDAPAMRPITAVRLREADAPMVTDPDGTEGVTLEPLPITSSGSIRRGWIVWVAGVAAAAALVAAIVMVNAVRQPSVDVVDDPAPSLVGADPAWAPTWVPDGLELWSLDVSRVEGGDVQEVDPAVGIAPPSVVQLVESPDRRTRLLVAIGGSPDHRVTGGDRTPLTIRGSEGWTRPLLSPVAGLQVGWQESGLTFSAQFAEEEPGAAIALLDRLEPASPDDPTGGFAAPDDPMVTVRTDDQRNAPATAPISAHFGYSSSRPVDLDADLSVGTMGASSGQSLTSLGYPSYLTIGFRGEIRPDGMAFEFAVAAGGGTASAQAMWPDGRSVFSSGRALDRATAERIATEVQLVSPGEIERWGSETSERVGAGDVLARADLPSATVEVIGGPEPVAMCLTTDGRRRCSLSDRMAGPAGSVPAPTQFGFATEVFDGRWYLFGANEGPVDVTVELGADSGTTTGTGPPDPSVQAETATVGTWTVALLVVPDGFDRATIASPDRSMTLPRPMS